MIYKKINYDLFPRFSILRLEKLVDGQWGYPFQLFPYLQKDSYFKILLIWMLSKKLLVSILRNIQHDIVLLFSIKPVKRKFRFETSQLGGLTIVQYRAPWWLNWQNTFTLWTFLQSYLLELICMNKTLSSVLNST